MTSAALFSIALLIGNQNVAPPEGTNRVFSAANLQAVVELDITGLYLCQGENSDGSHYQGAVKIDKKHDTYTLTWRLGRQQETSVGVGVRKGHYLAVSALLPSPQGAGIIVVIYDIQAGPKLVGRFTELGGDGAVRSETLILVKRLR